MVRRFVAVKHAVYAPVCACCCSLSVLWIVSLQVLALCALCGARLLNGYKQEAFHWIRFVGRPIRSAAAAVALETGAG